MQTRKSTSAPTSLAPAPDTLTRWLGQIRVGEPLTAGPLSVAALYARDPEAAGAPRIAYQTLAAAIAAGSVAITEQPQPTVPTLQLLNRSALAILIIDGDEVTGGQQNRVVNTTLLVPPRTLFQLPVSCVEAGRWHPVAHSFDTGEAVYPTLRRQKVAQVSMSLAAAGAPVADQHAVWDEVGERQRRAGTRSDTGAMRDVYLDRSAPLLDVERALPCPDDSPVGVIAFVDGRAACADLFDRPDTLREYWSRLIRSYALDVLDAHPAKPSRLSAERLLSRARRATRREFRSAGLGTDIRLDGAGIVGASLVHENTAVHTAIFRTQTGTTALRARIGASRLRERQTAATSASPR